MYLGVYVWAPTETLVKNELKQLTMAKTREVGGSLTDASWHTDAIELDQPGGFVVFKVYQRRTSIYLRSEWHQTALANFSIQLHLV